MSNSVRRRIDAQRPEGCDFCRNKDKQYYLDVAKCAHDEYIEDNKIQTVRRYCPFCGREFK
jgi:hypothetical protein